MATAKAAWEEKKARKAALVTEKATLTGQIAALADGDEKTRLEYKLGKLNTEDAAIDVDALKVTYDSAKGVFEAREKVLEGERKAADDTARAAAFGALKTKHDKLVADYQKAENQLNIWIAKKRASKSE